MLHPQIIVTEHCFVDATLQFKQQGISVMARLSSSTLVVFFFRIQPAAGSSAPMALVPATQIFSTLVQLPTQSLLGGKGDWRRIGFDSLGIQSITTGESSLTGNVRIIRGHHPIL